jgi:hypothetical protein
MIFGNLQNWNQAVTNWNQSMTQLPKEVMEDLAFISVGKIDLVSLVPPQRHPLGATHYLLTRFDGETRSITVARWKKLKSRNFITTIEAQFVPTFVELTDIGKAHVEE